jgi:hypothetical protein
VERWAELRRDRFVRRAGSKELARRYAIARNMSHTRDVSRDEANRAREEELAAVTVGGLERLDGWVSLVESNPGWPALLNMRPHEFARYSGPRRS